MAAERYELSGDRPRAVIIRFYSDGSYEEFWELTSCVIHMNTYWVRAQPDALPRMIIDTIRLPPGAIPPCRNSDMTDDAHTRFNAAFPWFDHDRWAWS